MMNPAYHFARMRDLLDEYEPSRERSLAQTKLDECELWLTRCTATEEARNRDLVAPAPAEVLSGAEVLGVALDSGELTEEEATRMIRGFMDRFPQLAVALQGTLAEQSAPDSHHDGKRSFRLEELVAAATDSPAAELLRPLPPAPARRSFWHCTVNRPHRADECTGEHLDASDAGLDTTVDPDGR